jgi:serine/threonine protein kinase
MFCTRCGSNNADNAKFCHSCGLDLSAHTPTGRVSAPQELTEVEIVRDALKDEYEIIDELGRGGMAIVFKAKERQLERDVAIKVLPFSLAFDKEFVERFQREARTSAKLEHPNIIPIYRVGKSGRVIYFVMKFLRGKPLSNVLAARGALPPAELRRVLIDVAKALAYAHRGGIVHRDIKPDNVMFDEHGHAIVTDFGIAKAATGGKLTGTGMAIGTPHYMSPEQARAQPLDGRSDLYSLGVVAYQCLAGQVPFDGEDSFSIGYKHIMEELPSPPLETAEHRSLFAVVRKMMAKLPEERFQTADELIQALEGGPIAAVSLTGAATTAIPSLAGRAINTSAPTTPLPRTSFRRPPTGVAAETPHKRSVAAALFIWLLIVGGALGGGGYLAYSQGLIGGARTAGGGGGTPGDTASVGGDSTSQAAGDSGTRRDTAKRIPINPATPGRLVLSGVPRGATVLVGTQPLRGSEVELPAGEHQLRVTARGFATYTRTIPIMPGQTLNWRVEMEQAPQMGGLPAGAGPCDRYGPAYNQNNVCWEEPPTPLLPPRVALPSDFEGVPRPSQLLFHISPEGETLEVRVYLASSHARFDELAMQLGRQMRWNPATKGGLAVESWQVLPIFPGRAQ